MAFPIDSGLVGVGRSQIQIRFSTEWGIDVAVLILGAGQKAPNQTELA